MTEKPFKNICVVGAGFMGRQISLQCAMHGYPVFLADVIQQALDGAVQFHSEELDRRVQAQEITAGDKQAVLGRIKYTPDLKEGASNADLVIEAVPERVDMKREVFGQLDKICPSHTILATNSSSLRISHIEDATQRPDRVLNAHFIPVVWQRPMVELMVGTKTSRETMETMRQFALSIGITPLMAWKESTGFLWNRIWRAIKKDALKIIDAGIASHEDIDRAWIIFTGMSVGPCAFMDMTGLDVIRDIEMVYYEESGDESDAPPQFLVDMVERGELGLKSGKGFYTYPNPSYEEPNWLRGGG
jgi:3-hydroxybutyryl-CoA dehydrogenase